MTAARLILHARDRINCGAYADIFRPPGEAAVYKLFVSNRHQTTMTQGLTNPAENERRRAVFESECAAYEIAAQDSFLREHVPASFRRIAVSDVLDGDASAAAAYLRNCCYSVEYIDGVARKLGGVPALPHIEMAVWAFRRAGILHMSDASVFFADDPRRFKFIDFAVKEFLPPSW